MLDGRENVAKDRAKRSRGRQSRYAGPRECQRQFQRELKDEEQQTNFRGNFEFAPSKWIIEGCLGYFVGHWG
jgi:hypothetical protein